MIVDKLKNADYYKALGKRFERSFEFLEQTNLEELAVGKYPIDGDDVFALVNEYMTKEIEDAKPEAHKNFIDIQYVVKGAEKMGYAPLEKQKVSMEYNSERDLMFFDTATDHITISEGMFAIFGPDDIHAPSIKINESKMVKKIVIKVKI